MTNFNEINKILFSYVSEIRFQEDTLKLYLGSSQTPTHSERGRSSHVRFAINFTKFFV